jgi:hypothetical protein
MEYDNNHFIIALGHILFRNRPPGVQPSHAGLKPASQWKSRCTPDLHQLKNSKDENDDNFCVRTPILANLGFLES